MLDAFGNFLAMIIGFTFWMCLFAGVLVWLFGKASQIVNDHRPPTDWSQVPYELRNGASLSSLELHEARSPGGGYNRSMAVTYDTSTVLPPQYRALPADRGPINNQLSAGYHNGSTPSALPQRQYQPTHPYYDHQRNQYNY